MNKLKKCFFCGNFFYDEKSNDKECFECLNRRRVRKSIETDYQKLERFWSKQKKTWKEEFNEGN